MIASSQFSNLQLGNLATWQFGNLAIWQLGKKCWTYSQHSQFSNLQLGNLATWQFGNLAIWQLGNFQNLELSILATFHFGNFQFNSSKLLTGRKYINHFPLVTFKSGQLSILAIFNLIHQKYILTFSKKYWNHFQIWQFPILATFNFGNFQSNLSKILTFSKKYWHHFQLCQISILAISNVGNLQFWHLAILAIFNLIHQKY